MIANLSSAMNTIYIHRRKENFGEGEKKSKTEIVTREHFLACGPTRTQLCTHVACVMSPRPHSQNIW